MISLEPLRLLLANAPQSFDHWFRSVGGAAEYAKLTEDTIPADHAWLITGSDKSKHLGERAELVTLNFNVVRAVDNTRATKTMRQDDRLLEFRQAVKTKLLGYHMEGANGPIQFLDGSVLKMLPNVLVWADRYECNVIVDNYLPDPPQFDNVVYIGEKL